MRQPSDSSYGSQGEYTGVIYNLPILTGIDLSPSLIVRIAAECPNVSGLKDIVTEYFHTVGALREVKRVRADYCVLSGWED